MTNTRTLSWLDVHSKVTGINAVVSCDLLKQFQVCRNFIKSAVKNHFKACAFTAVLPVNIAFPWAIKHFLKTYISILNCRKSLCDFTAELVCNIIYSFLFISKTFFREELTAPEIDHNYIFRKFCSKLRDLIVILCKY